MKTFMTCTEANQLDLVNYLDQLGFKAHKISRYDHWYHSPFRSENTPSFKVNRRINRWYDFGEGVGGSLVDFGIRYHSCSVADFLKLLQQNPTALSLTSSSLAHAAMPIASEEGIRLIETRSLQTLGLLHYLRQRRIPVSIASTFCKEIVYQIGPAIYSAIGFPNDLGGYEIRSARFKGSLSPKSPTTIQGSPKQLMVFEGLFDFLSYCTLAERACQPDSSWLILNSLSFLDRSHDFMNQFQRVSLFLDNDTAGQAATTKALSWGKQFKDQSSLYAGYKDLNEWITQIGKGQHIHLK